MPAAILFYDVVLSIHVMAIVAAFGLWFAYPLLVARGDAGAHRAQVRVARTVVSPRGRWRCWPASTWPATAPTGARCGSACRWSSSSCCWA